MAASMMHIMHGRIVPLDGRRFGVCASVAPNFAHLIPKFVLSEATWTPIQSPEDDYPPKGEVFYPGIEMMNAERGSFWEFSVKPNERSDRRADHDEVIACDVGRAKQAVDLSFFSIEEARQLLVEHGVDQPVRQEQPVFVKFTGDLWACLAVEFTDDLWKPAKRVALENVSLHRAVEPPALLEYAGCAFVPSSFRLGPAVREVDLTTDEMFTKALPRRLRQLLGDAAPAEPEGFPETITHPEVEVYLRASEILPNRRGHLEAFRDRFRAFVWGTHENVDIAEELFRGIRNQPAISRLIENEVTRLADSMRTRIKTEVETEMSANWERDQAKLVAEREGLESQLAALVARNKQAVSKLSDVKKRAEAIERGTAEVVEGLRAVLERAPKKSSEKARLIGRHVETVLGRGAENTLIPAELPPWSSATTGDALEVGPDELTEVLSRAAQDFAFDISDLERFDALIRAGELALLTGPDRETFLQAYSSAVAGGALRRMPLDLGVIGVDDLWRQPGTGQPTTFAHAWVAARAEPDIPVLIALDEVHTTSGWSWIRPLNDYLASDGRPRNLLVCMTARRIDPEHAEGFERAVTKLPRDAPSLQPGGSVASVSRCLGIEKPRLTRVRGCSETGIVDNDEVAKLIGAVGPSLDSSGAINRAAAVFRAARLNSSNDFPVKLASEFASFLCGTASRESAIVMAATRFDAECGIRLSAD